jgi:3-methyl-2-oxobutanoate hydroxymethyltransferase
MSDDRKKLTIPDILAAKRAGRKLAIVSTPDFLSANWAERAGADMVIVGDSLSMISYGHDNTLPLTVDTMIGHCQAVRRGAPNTFIFAAMPYGSVATPELAVHNALRFMKEGGVECVKIQAGRRQFAVLKAIADAGIPVMGHVGMCPHFMHTYGGFKVQGKTADAAAAIIDDAIAIQEAGGIGLEVEAVPAPVGAAIDGAVDIFTFGIGAGPSCTGQVLLAYDLIGAFDRLSPKFVKKYAEVSRVAVNAMTSYCAEVRSGQFPAPEHCYGMPEEEASRLKGRTAGG